MNQILEASVRYNWIEKQKNLFLYFIGGIADIKFELAKYKVHASAV